MSTLEILIALMIIVLAITVGISAVFGGQFFLIDGQLASTALYRAQTMLENTRVAALTNWDSIVTATSSYGQFSAKLNVIDVDDYVKSVESVIGWEASSGRDKTVELSTIFSNWQAAAAQSSCDILPLSSWSAPSVLGTFDTGIASVPTDIDVQHHIAYIAANGNSTNFDFFVVDISNSASPTIIRRLDTGPGLAAVHVNGNYAYVANGSINSQLQIIDITIPSAAYVRTVFKVPGSSSGDTPTAIYYYNNIVYLGLKKSNTLGEFHLIDVSDVDHPHEVGTWEFNTTVNGIYVSNGKAYVASPDNNELQVLDVHDPAHISLAGVYDAAGATSGKSVARLGNHIYLGRTVGNNELYVLHVDSISGPAVGTARVAASINGLTIQSNFVFMATNDANKEFQIWDTSDLSHIVLHSSLDLSSRATSIDCEGQTMYVTTDDTTHGLVIISGN